MAKFNVGDIVILNSDSESCPKMTVEGYFTDEQRSFDAQLYANYNRNLVKCSWRDINGVPYTHYYDEDALSPC